MLCFICPAIFFGLFFPLHWMNWSLCFSTIDKTQVKMIKSIPALIRGATAEGHVGYKPWVIFQQVGKLGPEAALLAREDISAAGHIKKKKSWAFNKQILNFSDFVFSLVKINNIKWLRFLDSSNRHLHLADFSQKQKPQDLFIGCYKRWCTGSQGFPGGSDGKETACNVEDPGSMPGSQRSLTEGNGSSFQYSCLENSMDSCA